MLATISGTVFEDLNHSFQRDADEVSAPSRIVYLDTNTNSRLDVDEPMVVAGPDGTFAFTNLADGTYSVQMYNGTLSQTQTFPIAAEPLGTTINVTGGTQLLIGNAATFALTPDSIVVGNLSSGAGTSLSVGSELTRMQTLPDGKLLVVGTDTSADTSWLVDLSTGSVTAIDLSGAGQATAWSQVSIDASGHGVLLEQSGSPVSVRAIDASDQNTSVQITTTTTIVPANTQVLSSATGNRSIFASPGSDGLALSLWSNSTASLITTSPIDVTGTTELLAFDDAAGLLALRTVGGGISVHDVDANFAVLHTVDDLPGPVAIDGTRDLLVTYSPIDTMLKLINLHDGTLVADLAVDLSSIGQVASLAMGHSPDSLIVLGAAGITEVTLSKPVAQQVTITGGQDADPVLLGIGLDGANTPPRYLQLPTLQTNEDQSLALSIPGALAESFDDEGDTFVLVQRSQAAHGSVMLKIDGSLNYTPDANFHGIDSVIVWLHDGREYSEVTLDIAVESVPDPLVGVNLQIDPVPENLEPDVPIGSIEVIDGDGFHHVVTIDDPRFGNLGEQLIFIGGNIDFETEWSIPINVTVSDPETGDTIEKTYVISVQDKNDPITAITYTTAYVFENSPGEVVSELQVHDQDDEQTHTLTVDDERFTIEGYDLRLVDGIAVDFETEQSIVVNVTATEVGSGGSFTQAITITVRNMEEQPQELGLAGSTVTELLAGDTVGDVTIDNYLPEDRYTLSVDDPRFEIIENKLKLRDDELVERAAQTEIQIEITAQDSLNQFDSLSRTFIIEVLENTSPLHNSENPYDVNHLEDVTALDALIIINYLNTHGPGPVGAGDRNHFYDVNADGFITALDALLVINELNRKNNGNTVGSEGDGEQAPPPNSNPIQQIAGAPLEEPTTDSGDELPQPLPSPAEKIVIVPAANPSSSGRLSIETNNAVASESFAQNVDEKLRLLSDKRT